MNKFSFIMRIIHRYLGFLLAGIMAVYAISGIMLVYRDVDGFKNDVNYDVQFETNLNEKQLAKLIKVKNFEIEKTENEIAYFKQGTYNLKTGEAKFTLKEYPFIIDKMVSLHKAKSENKLSLLNVFFGFSLLIYVITSFFMFLPKNPIFRKGMLVALIGLILGFVLLFIEV